MSKVYTLAAGQATDWIDCTGVAGHDLPFSALASGGAIATLQAANDEANEVNKPDAQDIESYAVNTNVAKVAIAPLPNFLRVKNTGVGTLIVTFGRGVTGTGTTTPVGPKSFPSNVTGNFSSP